MTAGGKRSLWEAVIPGEPMGKQSARGKRGQRSYTAPETRAYMKRAIAQLKRSLGDAGGFAGPVVVTIDSYKSRPEYLCIPEAPPGPIACPVKPDCDNISKIILDCCTKAGVLTDDSRVVDERVRTWWAGRDEEPGVVVVVEAHPDVWANWAITQRPASGPVEVARG